MNRYNTLDSNDEPELEGYSSRAVNSDIVEMDESWTLRSMIQRQASTVVALRKSELTESTAMESTEVSESPSGWNSGFAASVGAGYLWSDSDEISWPAADMGSDVHDSIEAIREEASRVDTAIALDQLDTLKNELESLRKQLNNRNSEIRGLKQTIQVKDVRLSTLQLERDLYKADVGGDEIETSPSVEPHFVIPWTPSSPSSIAERSVPDAPRSHPKSTARNRHSPSRLAPISSATISPRMTSSTSSPTVDHAPQKAKSEHSGFQRSPINSPFRELPSNRKLVPSTSQTDQGLHTAERDSHLHTQLKNGGSTPPKTRSQYISGTLPRQATRPLLPPSDEHATSPRNPRWNSDIQFPLPPRVPTALATAQPRQLFNDIINPSHSRNDAPARRQFQDEVSLASTITCSRFRRRPMLDDATTDTNGSSRMRSTRSRSRRAESTTELPTGITDVGTRSCLSMPKPLRNRRNKKTTGLDCRNSSTLERDKSSTVYLAHADEVTQLLRTSLETSEELRKRLALISTYYDSVVQELQGSLQSSDAERLKVENDLLNQIAVLERVQKNSTKDSEARRHYKDPVRNRWYPYGV